VLRLAFAREGARVVISGPREHAGQALAAELRPLGVEAEYVRANGRRQVEPWRNAGTTEKKNPAQAEREAPGWSSATNCYSLTESDVDCGF
jgi:hypothetical protein